MTFVEPVEIGLALTENPMVTSFDDNLDRFGCDVSGPTFYLVNGSRKTGEKRKIIQIILA
jgi:hypothetical protein